MDYTKSGIRISYEYELVDNVTLKSYNKFVPSVLGGSGVWAVTSDLRTSATIEIDSVKEFEALDRLLGHSAIRIWLIAEYQDSRERTCLGTYMWKKQASTVKNGRETVSLDLYSTLYKPQNQSKLTNSTFPQSATVKSKFESCATDCMCVPNFNSENLSATKTLGKNVVFEAGTSYLTMMQLCADTINGYLGVAPTGEITLDRYILPNNRPTSFLMRSNDYIVADGLEIAPPQIINEVIATYTYNSTSGGASSSTVLSRYARINDTSHKWYYGKIGGWRSEVIQPSTIENQDSQSTVLNKLQAAANQRLAEIMASTDTLTIKALYDPKIKEGSVGLVEFIDSPNATVLQYKVYVRNIEMEFDSKAVATYTMEVLYDYN